jgi:hypothetical protein
MEKNTSRDMYRIAAYTALGLVLFFIVMKFLNLATMVELRFVNFFILLLGVRKALLLKRKENNGRLEYLPGMLVGFMTALIASLIFAAFVFVYLFFFDHALMENIKTTQTFGNILSPVRVCLLIIIEGIASGAILSFAFMHLYNRDNSQG